MKKLIIFMVVFFISCNKKEHVVLSDFICNNNIEYWNYEWPRKRADYYGFTFSFNKNGKVIKYSYNKETKTRTIFSDNQYDGNSKWIINKDSILLFFDTKIKINRVVKDTIYAIDIKSKKEVKFIRVKNNLNIIGNR